MLYSTHSLSTPPPRANIAAYVANDPSLGPRRIAELAAELSAAAELKLDAVKIERKAAERARAVRVVPLPSHILLLHTTILYLLAYYYTTPLS